MPTVSLTCPAAYQMPAYAGRVVVTIMATPAEVWVTSDGTAPLAPTNTPRADGSNQKSIPGVIGAQTVTVPPIPSGHFVNPLIQVGSSGATVVELEY